MRAYQLDDTAPINVNQIGKISRSDSRRRYFRLVSGYPNSHRFVDAEVDALRSKVQELISREIGDFQVVKTHNARITSGGYPVICDKHTAGAVYLVRNPLDVVDSLADHDGITVDEAIALMNDPGHHIGHANGELVTQPLSTWSTHVESWLTATSFPVLLIRYEDLWADPVAQFSRLIKFLGWPYGLDRIQRAVQFSSFKSLKAAEAQHGFSELSARSNSGTFFRRGTSSAWQSVLAPHQVELVSRDHDSVMHSLGYDAGERA